MEKEKMEKHIKILNLIKLDEIVCKITDFGIVLKQILLVKKVEGKISSRKAKGATSINAAKNRKNIKSKDLQQSSNCSYFKLFILV